MYILSMMFIDAGTCGCWKRREAKNWIIGLVNLQEPWTQYTRTRLKQYRGRGIAHALCNRAFLFAKKHQYEVIPTCSYVRDTYLIRKETEDK